MALLARQTKQETKVEPLSAGMHIAVCYAVIDLGVQFNEAYQKEQHKIMLIWETDETMTTADGEVKPKAISKEFALSLHEKSDLFKTLTSWRGRAFTEEELEGFDVSKVLGAPCMLNIVTAEKNDKTYSNISSVTPLMKGLPVPNLVNKKVLFELSADTIGQIEELPQWIGDKIKKSLTYKYIIEQDKIVDEALVSDDSDPF